MTAQQALQSYGLGPTADDLIALTGIDTVSKKSREQLIELIEKRIDKLQHWQTLAKPASEQYELLAQKLTALRLKRLEIYNTLHPKLSALIQVGVA